MKIGWAKTDITPDEPVLLQGQFHARVSEGVKNPVVATAMALESFSSDGTQQAVLMISCDLVSISEGLREAVCLELQKALPEIPASAVILNATHTHTAPSCNNRQRYREDSTVNKQPYGIELPVMTATRYIAFAASRIAAAATEAWNKRQASGVAYGMGYAVIGRNRLVSYSSGKSRMYGNTDDPTFSHIEGYEDHTLNILGTYSLDGKITGLVVNFACPAQSWESGWQISADYWHELRQELQNRLNVFVLPQVSAAGDQSPHNRFHPDGPAQARMRKLAAISMQQDIAQRVADEVERIVPLIAKDINWNPVFLHHSESVPLPRRIIPEEDVEKALAESLQYEEQCKQLLEKFTSNPVLMEKPRWYTEISSLYTRSQRGKRVRTRFLEQKESASMNFEMHVLRIGDIIMISNPFELYLDFGLQIKAQSPAVQTFIVQLAGPGSYLPTARSIAGGAYGAVPASTEIGADGGKELVDWSLRACRELWLKGNQRHVIPLLSHGLDSVSTKAGLGQMLALPLEWVDCLEKPDISAVAGMGHTNTELLLAVIVDDQSHVNHNVDSRLWDGDALQLQLIDAENQEILHAVFALTSKGEQIMRVDKNTKSLPAVSFQISRDESNAKTLYKIALPLEAMGLNPKNKPNFRFNAGVFNADKKSVSQDGKWLQITPGLLGNKNTWEFRQFSLAAEKQE